MGYGISTVGGINTYQVFPSSLRVRTLLSCENSTISHDSLENTMM